MSEDMSKENRWESSKISKLSNEKLKLLAEEAQKIREELGDTPEIKNIESDIVNTQSYQRKLEYLNVAKLLYCLACLGIVYGLSNDMAVGDLWVAILLIGTFFIGLSAEADLSKLLDDDRYSKISPYIDRIKLRIKNLQLMSENDKLKEQLQEATEGFVESEAMKTFEEDNYDKRR